MKKIFKEIAGYDLKTPFDVMKYSDAVARFGCDKPDRRYGMEMQDLSQDLAKSGFNVFKGAISSGGIVKGFTLKKPKEMPRSRIDSLTEFVKSAGLGGLCYFKQEAKELSGPAIKFLSDDEKKLIEKKMNSSSGDYILLLAGDPALVNDTLNRLRAKLAREEALIKKGIYDLLWVTDFPLLKYNTEEKRWESEHHPFTAPNEEDAKYLESDIGKIRARSYDLVLNGVELGSGSIRIHQSQMQDKIFKTIGISKEEADERFGFLTEALSFGAPPHGGFAAGLDRLVAILCGCDSIREVIAFPKTQRAISPLSKAPSSVSKKQLDELGLELKE